MTMLNVDNLSSDDLPVPLHIHVVSHTPGRLRFRLAREHRRPEVMVNIANLLKSFSQEIQRVRISPATGSITVFYEKASTGFDDAMTTLQQMGMVVVDVPAGLSSASNQVSTAMNKANQWLEFKTEGAVDLRFLFPLVLGVLALRQAFAQSPGLNTAPWYVLAWYAFDGFYKLNYERTKPEDFSGNGHR
jgi:hypothetical protein